MNPAYTFNTNTVRLFHASNLDYLKTVPDNTFDSVVTDPPYGLSNFSPDDVKNALKAWLNDEPYVTKKKGFCGQTWDSFVPGPELWKEVFRTLKPGGHILVFSGTRTLDLMSMAIRLSGFEIRDNLFWTYFSGMPKSTSVGKLIDKHFGHERTEVLGVKPGHEEFVNRQTKGHLDFKETDATSAFDRPWMHDDAKRENYHNVMAPVSPEAKKWEGFGYALKPSVEPIILARKPLDGTIAENVLKWGTGGLNIDGCRIETTENLNGGAYSKNGGRNHLPGDKRNDLGTGMFAPGKTVGTDFVQPSGRYPSNLLLDGSQEVIGIFPDSKGQQGDVKGTEKSAKTKNCYGDFERVPFEKRNDSGSSSRFFFSAKASKHDRQGSTHPTVKPTSLMQYLVKLVTPPGGLVLEPFAGSGSTGVASVLEGCRAVLVEMTDEYIPDIKTKLENLANLRDDAEPIVVEDDADDDIFVFKK